MSDEKPVGRGRRLTDFLGLTEPQSGRSDPRLFAFLGFGSTTLAIVFLVLVILIFIFEGKVHILGLIFGILFLALGIKNLILWRRAPN